MRQAPGTAVAGKGNQRLDADGNPISNLDADGNPILKLDAEGNPIANNAANPVQKWLERVLVVRPLPKEELPEQMVRLVS